MTDTTKVSDDLSTRAVSSSTLAHVLPYPLYRGFVDLAHESPEPSTQLEPTELPDDTSNGPHFFYGLQWWFFGLLAIGGFWYLVVDEWRMSTDRKARPDANRKPAAQGANPSAADQRARSMPPSTGSITPETNEAAGESKKAAARPNSSGSP